MTQSLEWDALQDLHDGDHFPIKVTYLDSIPKPQNKLTTKWNIKKMDLCIYKTIIANTLQKAPDHEIDSDNINQEIELLETIINTAAQESSGPTKQILLGRTKNGI